MNRRLSIGILGIATALSLYACNGRNSGSNDRTEMEVVDDRPITDTLTTDPENYPVFSVSDTLHDFGTVRQGDVVAYTFHFKNTGSKPLVIRGASSTCGCTVPEYPKEPIPPGEDGALKVEFNSAGKSGRQVKPVFIQANTKPTMFQLTITCDVETTSKDTK